MTLTIDHFRQAKAMIEVNDLAEPQPVILTERDAAILDVESGIPGVIIVPNVRLIPRMESFYDRANQAHGVVR